jgi:hypothetical protein
MDLFAGIDKVTIARQIKMAGRSYSLRSAVFCETPIAGSCYWLRRRMTRNRFFLQILPVTLNDELQIDDRAKLTHQDHSKVFSTIVFPDCLF